MDIVIVVCRILIVKAQPQSAGSTQCHKGHIELILIVFILLHLYHAVVQVVVALVAVLPGIGPHLWLHGFWWEGHRSSLLNTLSTIRHPEDTVVIVPVAVLTNTIFAGDEYITIQHKDLDTLFGIVHRLLALGQLKNQLITRTKLSVNFSVFCQATTLQIVAIHSPILKVNLLCYRASAIIAVVDEERLLIRWLTLRIPCIKQVNIGLVVTTNEEDGQVVDLIKVLAHLNGIGIVVTANDRTVVLTFRKQFLDGTIETGIVDDIVLFRVRLQRTCHASTVWRMARSIGTSLATRCQFITERHLHISTRLEGTCYT